MVGMGRGKTNRMPFTQRADVEKCEGLVAFEDLHRGDFSWGY